ncbi:MAG TPA: SPOR domain-containing protein [Casimicrobiaceae bacterium]|nr:SPOR domain-containing protein [Casimicrobiaceae bacterium]
MAHRPATRRHRATPGSRNAGRGGTLLGIFIGLVMGLSIAAAVAFFLGRSGLTTPLPAPGASKDAAKSAKGDLGAQASAPDKPRFDFYKILPGADESKPGPDRHALDKLPERPPDKAAMASKSAEPVAASGDRFWLQAGAFASPSDAENMKARLALSGWEAVVQPVSLPDKSQRYRVRLGPYDNTDELNRVKTELGNRGFDVSVIKNQ